MEVIANNRAGGLHRPDLFDQADMFRPPLSGRRKRSELLGIVGLLLTEAAGALAQRHLAAVPHVGIQFKSAGLFGFAPLPVSDATLITAIAALSLIFLWLRSSYRFFLITNSIARLREAA